MATPTVGELRANLREQYDALPPSSKRLLALLLGLMAVLWVVGLSWWIWGGLAAQAEELERQEKNLRNLKKLNGLYQDAVVAIEAAEQRLSAAGNQPPSAFLEEKAVESGVKEQLKTIQEQGTDVVGSLQQTRYRVQLDRAPYEGTVKFLYAIETAGFLAVEGATMKANDRRGEISLTTTVDLVAYAPAEEGK